MNMLTVSSAGAVIFAAYLLVVLYILRFIAQRYAHTAIGQGLAALVH